MTLVRKHKRSQTYYKVILYPTLFNDFLLIHHCGMNPSRTCTKSYFKTKKEALVRSLDVISAKRAEGYELLHA